MIPQGVTPHEPPNKGKLGLIFMGVLLIIVIALFSIAVWWA